MRGVQDTQAVRTPLKLGAGAGVRGMVRGTHVQVRGAGGWLAGEPASGGRERRGVIEARCMREALGVKDTAGTLH